MPARKVTARPSSRAIAPVVFAVLVPLVGGLAPQEQARGQAAPLPPPRSASPKEPDAPKKPEAAKKPVDSRDGRCDVCGGCTRVRKVCVPKPKEREIKKVCWGYRCEDFCIPGPGVFCGTTCGKDECGCWSHGIWKPTCAEIRTKKVPVKTEVTRKVPGFEWIPEERCLACRGAGGAGPDCAASPAP